MCFLSTFPAIRHYRHDDSPEENLWAGRDWLYSVPIVPLATFQNSAGKYLILASDWNWLLNDLTDHHYRIDRLPIDTRAEAIGGFTPLAHGTPTFYTSAGDGDLSDAAVKYAWPVAFRVSDNLPRATQLGHGRRETMTTSFWPTATSTKTSALRWWHFALLAFAGLLLAGLSYTLDRKRVEVHVISPDYQTIESTISTSGTVTPIDDFPARANFSGVVEKVYVRLGQKVHAGQMLVLMKDQYALSRVLAARAALGSSEVNEQNVENNGSQDDRIGFAAELVRAKSEQAAAASAFATLEELEKRGSVSHAEVLAGSRRLQNANAALHELQQKTSERYSPSDAASWKERVVADKEALAAEKVSYGNAHITSPIAGTVYLLPVNQYDFVPAGSVLLQVADLNRIHVRANFEEVDVGNLQVGEPVTITWDGKPGQSWSGHVAEKPLAVTHSDASNVGSCTIDIDNPKSDLPVGTNVIVVVTVQKHDHVLTIPREALHSEGTAHYVYRVHDDRLVKTPVNLGIVNPLRAEITSGLEPRDVIALNRTDAHQLTGDLSVRAAK